MTSYRGIDRIEADTGPLVSRRVLVRVDLNLPLRDGQVKDTTRIERVAPTIRALAGMGAKVILLSQLGRPKGKVVPDLSLEQVVPATSKVLGLPIAFAPACRGETARTAIDAMNDGDVLLLENLRFDPGEEANDPEFADDLASLGDVYVNDAFSCSHRAHASVVGITECLPTFAGLNMVAELSALEAALGSPKRPVMAIVGGAKVSTKLTLLGNLVAKVDMLVIGGAMANTFLHGRGLPIGKSLCEHDMAEAARDVERQAEKAGCDILLPKDVVVAKEFKAGAAAEVRVVNDVRPGDLILDVGPDAVEHIAERLKETATVVWNGPLGAFETPPFDKGTVAIARAVAARTESGDLVSIAGGGDTVAALASADVTAAFSYVSTAGGAFLEWMEGKPLPGVLALKSGRD